MIQNYQILQLKNKTGDNMKYKEHLQAILAIINDYNTPEQGIARRHLDGFICQFKKQDNGKIYFFHTLDKITITE